MSGFVIIGLGRQLNIVLFGENDCLPDKGGRSQVSVGTGVEGTIKSSMACFIQDYALCVPYFLLFFCNGLWGWPNIYEESTLSH